MANNITKLVRWEATDPAALFEQARVRIERAQAEGRMVGVGIVVVEQMASGNIGYTCTNSPMPGEIALMAAYEFSNNMTPEPE